jgi:hypothetical protein
MGRRAPLSSESVTKARLHIIDGVNDEVTAHEFAEVS